MNFLLHLALLNNDRRAQIFLILIRSPHRLHISYNIELVRTASPSNFNVVSNYFNLFLLQRINIDACKKSNSIALNL